MYLYRGISLSQGEKIYIYILSLQQLSRENVNFWNLEFIPELETLQFTTKFDGSMQICDSKSCFVLKNIQ